MTWFEGLLSCVQVSQTAFSNLISHSPVVFVCITANAFCNFCKHRMFCKYNLCNHFTLSGCISVITGVKNGITVSMPAAVGPRLLALCFMCLCLMLRTQSAPPPVKLSSRYSPS